MSTKCEYLGKIIGESAQLLLTDEPLLMTDDKFTIKCNIESPKDLDDLITNPVIRKNIKDLYFSRNLLSRYP